VGGIQQSALLLTSQEQSLVQSSNAFGFKFFEEILKESKEKNVFVSPFSVSLALGMTYNGARENTKNQMHTTLEYGGLSLEEINQAYRSLIDLLISIDPSVAMNIANSIWYKDIFDVLDDFIAAAVSFFDAIVEAMDFSDPSAADTINSWVEEMTHGKIDKIVDGSISPGTVMFIINAIYFKGKWAKEFNPANTYDQTFYESDTKKISVKMMSVETKLRYLETSEFQTVDLPYGNGYFSMTIFLPKEGINVDEFLANFNDDNWQKWTSSLSLTNVCLQLPRFEMEFGLSLKEILFALGITDAFSFSKANFSGISAEQIFVNDVNHKTYVKVNEEGTEATAVTSVEISVTSVQPMDPIHMLVNRPFVLLIHESHSRIVLFIGKVVSPKEQNIFLN